MATKIRAEYSEANEVVKSSIQHASIKGAAEAMFEDEQKKQRAAEAEAAAMATKMRIEEDSRKANEAVKSSIQSLLSRGLRDEEYDAVLRECAQICTSGGLNLSVVLQEPLINGKPPVYWAILSGPTTNEAALHAFVLSLLDHTLVLALSGLSPLSKIDSMLLSSAAGGDVVDVSEMQDGFETFVARIQIRRFRLRMRVTKLVKVEFVTSGTNNAAIDNQWWLSFALGDHSIPAWVDGDFLVLRRLLSVDSDDSYETIFSLPLGCNPRNLQPGSKSTIKMRLDDGPMRPHLLNGSMSLVDCDGTLHAQFNVRLNQTPPPPPPPPKIEFPDGASLMSTKTTRPKSRRSLTFKTRNRDVPDGEKKVYTSLRRGGR
ncbi:hypothetical protein EI94DRAFT_1918477 [Lactarius quietus]|nr:hypothetical protein EI94DRAFT_1918477 [Lactarius quietus]